MTWFKLAAEGAFHGKVIEAGNEAYGAWCRAGQWSSEHLTEGFLPEATALLIAPRKVWAKLAAAKAGHEHGLVEPREGGWQIHDFLDWNPPAEEALAKRATVSEHRRRAGRAGGLKSGATRRAPSADEADAEQNRSKQTKQTDGFASPTTKQNEAPSPIPSPSPIPDASLREASEARASESSAIPAWEPPAGDDLLTLAAKLRDEGNSLGANVCERAAKGHRPTDGQLGRLRQIRDERGQRAASPRGGFAAHELQPAGPVQHRKLADGTPE